MTELGLRRTDDGPLPDAYALTLASGQRGGADALGRDTREALGEAGAKIVGERTLSTSALETVFHGDPRTLVEHLKASHADRPTDWCVRAAPVRAGRLLVCDMDSTIIGCECIDEIAEIVGIGPEIAAVTERAMRGELDFEAALEARVIRLKGATEADLERVWVERVRLNPGAATLVATMKALGARTVLVSGGFTWFTARVAELAGFDANAGNVLETKDGRLTGRVTGPILGRAAKRETLAAEARALCVAESEAVGLGDGSNDLDMLGAAGLGIAYCAKPAVEAQATARIASGDLRSALYFQGLTERDFIERG